MYTTKINKTGCDTLLRNEDSDETIKTTKRINKKLQTRINTSSPRGRRGTGESTRAHKEKVAGKVDQDEFKLIGRNIRNHEKVIKETLVGETIGVMRQIKSCAYKKNVK